MTTDGGGYTYYGVTGAITTSKYTDNNTCKTLGMDIVYPRRQTHWASMFARYNSSYFATVPGVYKTSSGGNYTGCAMNSSGCGDCRVGAVSIVEPNVRCISCTVASPGYTKPAVGSVIAIRLSKT